MILGDAKKFNTVYLEFPLVLRAVVLIATETIELVDDDGLKQSFTTIINHVLEVGTLVRGCSLGAVGVDVSELVSFLLTIVFNGANLGVDGFVTQA